MKEKAVRKKKGGTRVPPSFRKRQRRFRVIAQGCRNPGKVQRTNAGACLPCPRVLPVQGFAQTREVRIERDETSGSLEERSSAGFFRKPAQRTLAIARSNPVMTRQPHRRRIETEHRHVSFVSFLNCSLQIDCVTRGS